MRATSAVQTIRLAVVKAVVEFAIPFVLPPTRNSAVVPFLRTSQMGRRMAEEAKIAYEKNSRRMDESLASQNAGLRIVAEEREKYNQRQT